MTHSSRYAAVFIARNPCRHCGSKERYESSRHCIPCALKRSTQRDRRRPAVAVPRDDQDLVTLDAKLTANGRCPTCKLLAPCRHCLPETAAEILHGGHGPGRVYPEGMEAA